jgi:glycosyltransferase involved in cell wall biosynthesis
MNAVCKDLLVTNPYYVPHCVDTDLYVTATGPREPFLLSVVWMVGENPKRKCLAQAIEAFAPIRRTHPRLRYVIIGEKGDAHPWLADLAVKLGVSHSVEFTGVVSREEKISLMQRCALYLQPSIYEGFGLAILEAMSCGAPVVTSAVGAVPEVVGDAAVFVDGTSPLAVANGVLGLLASPDRALQLGRIGRQRAVQLYPLRRRWRSLAELVARQLQKRGWQLPPQSPRIVEEPLAPELKQK